MSEKTTRNPEAERKKEAQRQAASSGENKDTGDLGAETIRAIREKMPDTVIDMASMTPEERERQLERDAKGEASGAKAPLSPTDEEIKEALERIKAKHLLRTRPPLPIWTLRDSLKKAIVGLIAGEPGTGKTYAVLDVACAVSTGGDAWGIYETDTPGSVYMVCCEPSDDIHGRLHKVAKVRGMSEHDLKVLGERLHIEQVSGVHAAFYTRVQQGVYTATLYYQTLLRRLKLIDDLSLVILDPMSRMFRGTENDSGEATYFIELCERIANETGAAVIVTHHTPKSRGTGGNHKQDFSSDLAALHQDAVRGSGGFAAAARWVMVMRRCCQDTTEKKFGDKNNDPYVICKVVKKNEGSDESHFFLKRSVVDPETAGTLQWINPDTQTTAERKQREEDEQDAVVKSELLEWLRDRAAEGNFFTRTSIERSGARGLFPMSGKGKKYGRDKLLRVLDKASKTGDVEVKQLLSGNNKLTGYFVPTGVEIPAELLPDDDPPKPTEPTPKTEAEKEKNDQE